MDKKTQAELTIFDRILKGEIPCDTVYEDDDVLAFHDIQPQAPVHVLVIPKSKIVSFADVKHVDQEQKIAKYFQKISYIAHALGLDDNGYRVVFNHGKNGAQTVNYIHAHILGGRPLGWPPG